MAKKYLIVTESEDKAKTIARELGAESDVILFPAQFNGEESKMIMTCCRGQITKFDFFDSWSSCNPVTLFDELESKRKQKEDPICKDIKNTLARYSCDGIIIWTDNDMEGDNIGKDILNLFKNRHNLEMYRVRCSEITNEACITALENRVRLNYTGGPALTTEERQKIKKFENAVSAEDVRDKIDLVTGAAFTRLIRFRYNQIFPEEKPPFTYGNCAFPVLGYVVERTKNIHNNTSALIDETKKTRPMPLNTAELLKNMSKFLKISVEKTRDSSKSLYCKGYISYPHTSTNRFPDGHLFDNFLRQIEDAEEWKLHVQKIRESPNPRREGKSDGAHPPIHPIKYPVTDDTLSDEDRQVYQYIFDHFLASIYKDAETENVDAIQYNYLDVYNYKQAGDPPSGYIHEADIIDYMVENNIGTSSTYATHIKNLKYPKNWKNFRLVDVKQDCFIRAKPSGVGLIEGFKKMDSGKDLTTSTLRREFLTDLEEICENDIEGEIAKRVLDEYVHKYKSIYKDVEKHLSRLDEALAKNTDWKINPVLMKCPKCGSDVVLNKQKSTICTLFNYCTHSIELSEAVEECCELPEDCKNCGRGKMIEIKLKNYSTRQRMCFRCSEKKDDTVIINQPANENDDNENGQNGGDGEIDGSFDQNENSPSPKKRKIQE